MSVEVAWSVEILQTEFAGVWFESCVYVLVHLEVLESRKPLAALVALMWCISRVNLLVRFQGLLGQESLPT